MTSESPADPAFDTIRSSRLRALLRYWAEKSAGRAMPLREQIEPLEIPTLLSIAMLADVAPNGPRMRLLGSEATEAYGRETRGQPVVDIQFGDFTVPWLSAFFSVIKSAKPAFAAGTYRRGSELCRIETVLMPLTEDGSSVSQIFGGLSIRQMLSDRTTGQNSPRDFSIPFAGVASDGMDSRQGPAIRDYR
jgi:hypothetical protein